MPGGGGGPNLFVIVLFVAAAAAGLWWLWKQVRPRQHRARSPGRVVPPPPPAAGAAPSPAPPVAAPPVAPPPVAAPPAAPAAVPPSAEGEVILVVPQHFASRIGPMTGELSAALRGTMLAAGRRLVFRDVPLAVADTGGTPVEMVEGTGVRVRSIRSPLYGLCRACGLRTVLPAAACMSCGEPLGLDLQPAGRAPPPAHGI